MVLEPVGNAKANFPGLPDDEALQWAKQMPEHSMLSFTGALTNSGYETVPVTYFLTEKDLTVPPAMQREQIKTIETAKGAEIEVLTIPTDHFPYITAPEEVAQVIRKVVAGL